jgi:hypothetical protein
MDRRESNRLYVGSESEGDEEIPQEISDDEQFEVAGRASERFAPRASISSQGSRREPTQVLNARATAAARDPSPDKSEPGFESGGAESYHAGGMSSGDEEIVEEKVVDLQADSPPESDGQNFREQYLNVDKEAYRQSKDEYPESQDEPILEAGFSTMLHEEEGAHELNMQRRWSDSGDYEERRFVILPDGRVLAQDQMAAPIQEQAEGEYTTPEKDYPVEDDLLKISQEVKKKDQSRKMVLWEGNEMRAKWEDSRPLDRTVQATQRTYGNKWDLLNKTRPQDIAPKPKVPAHYENLTSKVPAITDYPRERQWKEKVRPIDKEDPLHELRKTDRKLTNIFYQSTLQKQLQFGKNVNSDVPPTSHGSLEKKQQSQMEGRPIFGAPSNRGFESSVNTGRQRMFYQSQVF